MASQADANRVLARMEMDRLHNGMVFELDRRLAQGGRDPEAAARGPGEDADVGEALQIVQQTVTSLRDLKRGIESRDRQIADQEAELARTVGEIEQMQRIQSDLEGDLVQERGRVAALEGDLHQLQADFRTLENERDGLEEHLRQIVDVIKSSLNHIVHEPLEPAPAALTGTG